MNGAERDDFIERAKCVTVILSRGLTAPIWQPIVGGLAAAGMTLDPNQRNGHRNVALNIGTAGNYAIGAAICGAVAGIVTGFATATDAICEGPYQLVAQQPRSSTTVERFVYAKLDKWRLNS